MAVCAHQAVRPLCCWRTTFGVHSLHAMHPLPRCMPCTLLPCCMPCTLASAHQPAEQALPLISAFPPVRPWRGATRGGKGYNGKAATSTEALELWGAGRASASGLLSRPANPPVRSTQSACCLRSGVTHLCGGGGSESRQHALLRHPPSPAQQPRLQAPTHTQPAATRAHSAPTHTLASTMAHQHACSPHPPSPAPAHTPPLVTQQFHPLGKAGAPAPQTPRRAA